MAEKTLTQSNYKYNFVAFIWHALFLALLKPFLDTDTIIPAMILKSGGNEMLIGIATAILVGMAAFFQFFFGVYVSNSKKKKKHLLWAIYLRVISIVGLASIFVFFDKIHSGISLILIFLFITTFSTAGAYGGVSYTDMLGKSILQQQRKALFSLKNMIGAVAYFGAAFVAKTIIKKYNFPLNYSYLYIIAAVLLFIASAGFVAIKEKPTPLKKKKSFTEFVKLMPQEFKNNKNLLYFVIITNTLGLAITSFPFLVSYAKFAGHLNNKIVGNFLVLKVTGMVLFSSLVFVMRNKLNYRNLLIISVILGATLPIVAYFTVSNTLIYSLNFFVAGSIFALFRIAKEGIVIEISNDQNRAEYAGIVGTGSLLMAILPLFSGILIKYVGYKAVFISISIIVFSSLFYVRKLNCHSQKSEQ